MLKNQRNTIKPLHTKALWSEVARRPRQEVFVEIGDGDARKCRNCKKSGDWGIISTQSGEDTACYVETSAR